MKKIEPNKLPDNYINIIGNEWMLVTAGTKEKFNTMTASWGGTGFLWNRPVVFIFIRPERYTYEFIENGDYFTLSFLGQEHKDVHKICGCMSGRYIYKIKATGIQPYFSESGNILFKEARISIECKKLYTDMIKEENFLDKSLFEKWYGGAHGNPHKVYVAEIVNMWVNE